jgi:hypothetical protein
MQFHNRTLAVNGTDFFDLMTQQMIGVHRHCKSKGDLAYEDSIKKLFDCVGKEKVAAIHEVDNAVGMLAAETDIQSYKNGFSDAICMILQAAMHGK